MDNHQRQGSTTILHLPADLRRKIFLRLPSLPSLVRAAVACPTFLHAVRSSPAFRRRFQALHMPQVLGFFHETSLPRIPPFIPRRGPCDPDHTAVIRHADFLLTALTEDPEHYDPSWEIASCHGGYVVLLNLITDQVAAFNPVTQSLDVLPQQPDHMDFSGPLEYHIVLSQEDPSRFRVLCIRENKMPACIAVFSSATREWTPIPQPHYDDDGRENFDLGRQLDGLIYWKHAEGCALVLTTATLQLSEIDLPALLVQKKKSRQYALGHTKDGTLCLVGADDTDATTTGNLFVWLWGVDDDGVDKWILDDTFPLDIFVDEADATVQVEDLVDGTLYISCQFCEPNETLKSFCLETKELDMLFDQTYQRPFHPYNMAWPLSLISNKSVTKQDLRRTEKREKEAELLRSGTKEEVAQLRQSKRECRSV